jgi:hypothetical protein
MPLSATELRTRAIQVAIERLRESRPTARFVDSPAGYLVDWSDNLLDGVTPDLFEADLRRGAGGELDDTNEAPAKFRAAHSSSALVVNTFGPFRRETRHLTLGGISDFDRVEFEYACDNGLQGTFPHADLLAQTRHSVLAVESKFLEPLTPKPAAFTAQYQGAFDRAERPWRNLYHRLCSDALTYRYLDAAQLLKHYLGLWHSFPDLNRTLFFLYWEPSNAADLSVYRDFRREITDFALAVAGCDTRFVAKSYRAQLQDWQHNRSERDLSAHIDRLTQRYTFPL